MSNNEGMTLVPLELFCSIAHVETTLIDSLEESGLVQITVVEQRRYITEEELLRTERLVRLHDDLGINVEGIEAIEHLLQRMQTLKEEMNHLQNRLRRYESH